MNSPLLTVRCIVVLALLTLSIVTVACSKPEQTTAAAASGAATPASDSNSAAKPSVSTPPAQSAPSGPKPNVDGNHVMRYVKEVVAFGSRPVGSPGHAKLEQYILSKLKGVDVEQDKFTAETPVGKFAINNIIAKFPGREDGIIVVAGHYDTNYPLPKTYVGANDGGSSTAMLLALADQFRGRTLDGYSVWLVWTDGEEAFVKWTATDSLYGTRQLAEKWEKDGTAGKIKALMVVDMLGDADLDVLKETRSTPWLSELVYQAASNLGYQSHFYKMQGGVDDDHMPFLKIGVPAVDIIDLDYGYNNVFHHTPQDTIDKLSPQSLAISTDVVLETIQLINAR
ncbi:MAG: M28 family peptidase [Acidobacteriota bacterium]|nr:M28 family peptidase [Acidobacteriota bacterium]